MWSASDMWMVFIGENEDLCVDSHGAPIGGQDGSDDNVWTRQWMCQKRREEKHRSTRLGITVGLSLLWLKVQGDEGKQVTASE